MTKKAFTPPALRAYKSYDPIEATNEAAALQPYDPVSLTVQSQADDANINILMARMGVTGRFPENPRVPTYGDFSQITDYRSALDAVRNANEAFMELPAELRARFENDPQQLLEWAADPASRPDLQRLGMLKPQPPAPPAPGLPQPGGNAGPGPGSLPGGPNPNA